MRRGAGRPRRSFPASPTSCPRAHPCIMLCFPNFGLRADMTQTEQSPSPGGARRGAQVLGRLREYPPNIWYRGEEVRDVTSHPAFRGGVGTLARLYDLQWEQADKMLFDSPSSGRKVGRSFMLPATREELSSIS